MSTTEVVAISLISCEHLRARFEPRLEPPETPYSGSERPYFRYMRLRGRNRRFRPLRDPKIASIKYRGALCLYKKKDTKARNTEQFDATQPLKVTRTCRSRMTVKRHSHTGFRATGRNQGPRTQQTSHLTPVMTSISTKEHAHRSGVPAMNGVPSDPVATDDHKGEQPASVGDCDPDDLLIPSDGFVE